MSASWLIFTPLSSEDSSALVELCHAAIEAHLEASPGSSDAYGEVSASGVVPSEKEAAAAHAELDLSLSRPLRDRLKKCRSAITVENPAPLARSRLQVSVLKLLLERSGDALLLPGSYPLQASGDVLRSLSGLPDAPGFGAAGPQGEAQVSRAERILDTFEAAESNVELSIDLRQQLGLASEPARRYAMLLMQEGAADDVRAAKLLEMSEEELERAANELDVLLGAIRAR